MKLVIVESPHKSETIGRFLGSDYKVLASKGHIRDLASSGKMGLGVDIENGFAPVYKVSPDKAQIVKELKSAVSKADEVYLATDPDREGEAIAWHLAIVLGLDVKTTPRIEFHEVTESAVLKALQNPRTIDMDLVESQEARRIIDRLMGYRLSNLLQRKIKSKSAGRVQSVVLKFIVDREKEIQAFVPEEFWTIDSMFAKNGDKMFKGNLSAYQGKALKIHNEEEAKKIISEFPEEFKVTSVKSQINKTAPRPPFITATLQQEAFTQCHFSTRKTSSVAQRLYEGEEIDGVLTGLITYMRTDSIRLADEFVAAAKQHITVRYGKEYLGHAYTQKAAKNVQDAHEAIRPTDITLTPERVKPYLSRDEFQLYTLIYDRAIASLMSARQNKITTVTLSGNEYDFTSSQTKNVFPGYYAIYGKYEEKEEANKLPADIKEGDTFTIADVEKTQHFTKAPGHYNDGKIVKLMQESKIGRPSTYSNTVDTLVNREYVEKQKDALVPTEQGELTVDRLEEYFPKYMDAGYTAGMEEALDNIADGKTDRNKLLTDFWTEFSKYFESAQEHMEKLQPKVVEGRVCPVCGKPLVYRKGRYGEFVGCSDYPNCTYIEKQQPDVITDHVCPRCGGQLVKRKGKRGEFVGCSNYPHCTYMEDLNGKPLDTEKKAVEIPADAPLCPACKVGHLIEKTSRWGKKFIGCSNYPSCHYIQKDESESAGEKKTYRRRYSKKK